MEFFKPARNNCHSQTPFEWEIMARLSSLQGSNPQWLETEKTNCKSETPAIGEANWHFLSLTNLKEDGHCLDVLSPGWYSHEQKWLSWVLIQSSDIFYSRVIISYPFLGLLTSIWIDITLAVTLIWSVTSESSWCNTRHQYEDNSFTVLPAQFNPSPLLINAKWLFSQTVRIS